MKIHKKKSVSLEDETALVHLERRHTLKEDTNEADSDNLRKTIRANSLGSFGEGHSSTDIEAATAGKPSSFTRRPTVITESELVSSSLYKDRKAKINSDDESVDDPRPSVPQADLENLEPRTLSDPNLKPAPVQRPRKTSSCCWYFTIVLVICIACLAVMAGIAGIVYLEYFTKYKETDTENTNVLEKNDNLSASKETFQHPALEKDNIHRNEPKIPESILRRIIKNSTKFADKDISRKVVVARSQPNKDIFHNNDQIDSKNSETEELSKIASSIIYGNQVIEMIEHPKTTEQSDVSRDIHGRFNVPISDKSAEIQSNVKNQDSLDLNLNIQSKDITSKIRDGHIDEVHEQLIENGSTLTEKSNSKAEVFDSSKETLSGRNFNFDEMTTLQGIELKVDKIDPEISFQKLQEFLEDKSLAHMDNFINDNKEENSLNLKRHDIDHDAKDNSLVHTEHSSDHDPNNNLLDHSEHSIDHNPNNSFDFIENSNDPNPNNNPFDISEHSINLDDKILKDHMEDSSDFDSNDSSSEEQSLTVTVDDPNLDSDDSAQLVFIRPVVESKAVPIPLAFLRRIGFDIKNPNSHQPLTAQDMDIKFSLAEALKYLRSLDTENKLPVSREKTVTQRTSHQKENKKTIVPLKAEREEYLNLLRKHIFEESS